MADDIKIDHLDRFSELSEAEVKRIAQVGTHVTVPSDWALMGEGTAGDKAYLLISGRVSVRHHGEEVAQLGPGDLFGEMAIVQHRLRSATVVSLERLDCLHFTRDQIEQLESEIPKFRAALEASTAARSGNPSQPE